MNTGRDNNNTTKEKTMTKAQKTALANYIRQERSEETLPGNIMFFITINKKAFGIKQNKLCEIFIKYGLMDDQGNHIGY